MIVSELQRENRVILADQREAEDLLFLLRLVGIAVGNPTAGTQPGEMRISLPENAGEDEFVRAEGVLAEFNRMRSTRVVNRTQN